MVLPAAGWFGPQVPSFDRTEGPRKEGLGSVCSTSEPKFVMAIEQRCLQFSAYYENGKSHPAAPECKAVLDPIDANSVGCPEESVSFPWLSSKNGWAQLTPLNGEFDPSKSRNTPATHLLPVPSPFGAACAAQKHNIYTYIYVLYKKEPPPFVIKRNPGFRG